MTINEAHYREVLNRIAAATGPTTLATVKHEAMRVPYADRPHRDVLLGPVGHWRVVLHFQIGFERDAPTQAEMKAIYDADQAAGTRTSFVNIESWLLTSLGERLQPAASSRLLVVPPGWGVGLLLRDPWFCPGLQITDESGHSNHATGGSDHTTHLRIPAWSCAARGWRFDSLRLGSDFEPHPVIEVRRSGRRPEGAI